MYIRGLIPRNFAKLAEVVPIAVTIFDVKLHLLFTIRCDHLLPGSFWNKRKFVRIISLSH